MSVPGGLLTAGMISMGITVTISLIIANQLNTERITWEQAGYWIMGMLFLASFSGATSAYCTIKRQRLTVSVMSGTVYWVLLLCVTALFFGGNYEAVPETAAIIIAGSGCAAMVSLPQKGRRGRKRKTH